MNKKTRHRIQRMQVNCKYQRKTYERNEKYHLFLNFSGAKAGYNIGDNSKVSSIPFLKLSMVTKLHYELSSWNQIIS